VVGASKDGGRFAVRFSGRPREELQVSTRDVNVVRYRFQPGDEVRIRIDADKVGAGRVVSAERGDHDVLVVEVAGETRTVKEADAAAQPPSPNALEGVVRWTIGPGTTGDKPSGMGVEFTSFGDDVKAELARVASSLEKH
jgi:hypothetical protein